MYGNWKEVSKMLPEAKGKKEANRMAKEWLDTLNAEADLMPNAGEAKIIGANAPMLERVFVDKNYILW